MIAAFAGLVPFQVAFVVHDLQRAVLDFDGVLGAGPWRGYVFDESTIDGREYHGRPADWSFRAALNHRRPQYELIEPLSGPTIYADWLDSRGAGFHHVAYVVESLEQTTAQMVAAGHPAIQRGHSFGAARDGAFAYYDTAQALGFIVEAVEAPGRMPDPAFRL